MKTITFDETKWKLVPVEPTPEMKAAGINIEGYSEVSDSIGALTWAEVDAIYRAMLAATPAAPSQPVTRPQNCGTSFCSCIECVCESEPVTLTDGLIEKGAMTGMVDAQIDDIIAALREKEGKG